MSQGIWNSINPYTTSGLMLAGLLDDFKDAFCSGFSGATRPANLQAGGFWIDTTNQGAPTYYWSLKIYNGSTDLEVFRISILNSIAGSPQASSSFEIKRVSADTTGAILNFIKQRVDTNGQVLSGDTVFELSFYGRTVSGTDTRVGYMRWNATDDMETGASGGTLSFFATPDGTAALAEHLRLIEGSVESVVPYKITALQAVSQNVATTATIAALDADKFIVEMTGSTTTSIQGIDATGDSKVVTIHNRSSAVVTLKHQDSSASANNRIKMPNSLDMDIPVDGSAQLFYCTTDLKWKLRSAGSPLKPTRAITTLAGLFNTYTVPAGVARVRVKGYRGKYRSGLMSNPLATTEYNGTMVPSGAMDSYGNINVWGSNTDTSIYLGDNTTVAKSSPVAVTGALKFQVPNPESPAFTMQLTNAGRAYGWGSNANGQVGDASTTTRNAPIAVAGNITFSCVSSDSSSSYGLTPHGKLYAWGSNNFGQLGLGDVTSRSSPVAVLGGLTFQHFQQKLQSCFALTSSGTAYAWGRNTNGQLGVGDVAARSSPVAVLGGLAFKKLAGYQFSAYSFGPFGEDFGTSMFGLTAAGALYSWGYNFFGQLGVGDQVPRSSPVAVLGGITFDDIVISPYGNYFSIYALTSDGTLYAWGLNTEGQLGVGDVTARSSPVAVVGGLKFKSIFPSGTCVYGLSTGGLLYAWGGNGLLPNGDGASSTMGQLGVGDRNPRSSPVLVVGSLAFTGFSAGGGMGFGVTKEGALYAWGANYKGALGNGSATTPASSPVLVVGGLGGLSNTPVSDTTINVSAGSYTVLLGHAACKFGDTPIGFNIDSVTIEYDK